MFSAMKDAQDVAPDEDEVVDLKIGGRRRLTSVQSVYQEEEVLSRGQLYDFLLAERDQVHHCSTLSMTLMVWMFIMLSAWLHYEVESSYLLTSLIRGAVENIEVDHMVSSKNGIPVPKRVNLQNLTSMDEVYTWIGTGLVPMLAHTPESPGVVRSFNHVVRPGVQLRQRRVVGAECPVSQKLRDYFRSECRSQGSVLPKAFGPEVNASANETADWAFVAGGGFQMASLITDENPKELFWAFLRVNFNETLTGEVTGARRIAELEQQKWMDEATASLKVVFTLFNPELAMFCHTTVQFNFARGGLIEKQLDVNPLPMIVYTSIEVIVVDVIWMLLTCFILFAQMQEVADRKGMPCGTRCCGRFWLLTEWIFILMALGVLSMFLVYALGVATIRNHMVLTPIALAEVVKDDKPITPGYEDDFAALARSQALADDGRLAQLQEDLSLLVNVRLYNRLGMFYYVAMILFRFFRGFAGQPRIAAIGKTISSAFSDLVHAMLIVFVAFMNLSLGGNILFGRELKAWSTWTDSWTTTLGIIFGNGDIGAMWDLAPMSTTIWMCIYVICMVIMLLNMITAILVDHHKEVRSKGGRAMQTLPSQIAMVVSDMYWKRSYDMRFLLRFAKTRASKGGKLDRILPKIGRESKRIARVPFAKLIHYFGPAGSEEMAEIFTNEPILQPWSVVTKAMLIEQGLDDSTAKRLMWKCKICTTKLPTDEMPVARLFEEFDAAMREAFGRLQVVGEEFKNWVSERNIDAQNMEPRQRKLDSLMRSIEPAEPMFGLESMQYALSDGGGLPALQEDDDGTQPVEALEPPGETVRMLGS